MGSYDLTLFPNKTTGAKDLCHKRFGRLTVIAFGGLDRFLRAVWICRCDCGTWRAITSQRLLSLNRPSRSCRCLRKDTARRIRRTHGLSRSRPYRAWKHLKERCFRQGTENFKDYGGRGITVCERWLSFKNFLADMGHPPANKTSIDRIDNNGNYEPGNCRWATALEQGTNKRNNIILTLHGESLVLSQWARRTGFRYGTILRRLSLGWSMEAALTEPVQKRKRSR